jgi:hypothetical protein
MGDEQVQNLAHIHWYARIALMCSVADISGRGLRPLPPTQPIRSRTPTWREFALRKPQYQYGVH